MPFTDFILIYPEIELGTGYVSGERESVGGMFGIFGRVGIYLSISHENKGKFDQTNSKNG